MAGWIGTLMDSKWTTPPREKDYPRLSRARKRLKYYIKDKLIELGKRHESLVRSIRDNYDVKDEYEQHKKTMAVIIRIL